MVSEIGEENNYYIPFAGPLPQFEKKNKIEVSMMSTPFFVLNLRCSIVPERYTRSCEPYSPIFQAQFSIK